MGRGPDVCAWCYRHVCLKCGWYKVLSATVSVEATCYRCGPEGGAVVMREVAHSGWNVCPFAGRLGNEAPKGVCTFCGRERNMRFLVEADGEMECRSAARCATYQRRNGMEAA